MGATGYIGGRLVPELADAGHEVRCLTRRPEKLAGVPWAERVEVVRGDALDPASLTEALADIDVVYYLVHSIGTGSRFEDTDRRGGRERGRRRQGGGHGAPRLPRRPGAGRGRDGLGPPGLPGRGRPDLPGLGRPRRGAPGRGRHRQRQRVLRDAALPDRAPAGHGHPPLGVVPGAAHRGARRADLPGRRARPGRGHEPALRRRRARRPDLPGDDAALRRRGRACGRGSSSPSGC